MTAKDIISDQIPCIYPEMKVSEAIARIEEAKLKCLPVVSDRLYRGIICEKELLTLSAPDDKIGDMDLYAPSVRADSHILEVLNRMAQLSLDILTVVSADNEYLGSESMCSLLFPFSTFCHTSQPGAIIEIAVRPGEYSATEICRLVEDNNSKVVSLFSFPDGESGMLTVAIKIDREDASSVLRSLERFNYRILRCYQHQDVIDERTEHRFRELMYYLEM